MTQQPEKIFNLFVYSTLDLVTEVGVVTHSLQGSDEDKILFLKQNVDSDFITAEKFELPENFRIKIHDEVKKGIDYASYRNLCNQGHGLLIFENIFNHFSASSNPLVVVTPVKNGKIFIEGTETIKNTEEQPPKFIHIDKQKEWYVDYIDNEGFHFDRLINDDFIEAIRILFNAKHYVSAMKLLMICVDTVSYLEFGDEQKNFHNWINTYAELDTLDISADELWEFRNSILHMTNLDSRKVKNGQIKRLMFYVSKPGLEYVKETEEGKYFSFKKLLDNLALGISKWAKSYDIHKDKFEILLSRYDRIISDKRMTYTYYENQYSS